MTAESAADHFVYRLLDSDDALLYVGCSVNVERRLAQHKCDKSWAAEIATYTVEGPYRRLDGYAREQSLIRCLRPLYNVHHNPLNPNRRAHLAAQMIAKRLGSPVAPIETAMYFGELPAFVHVPDDVLTEWVWRRYSHSGARWAIAYRASHPRPQPLHRVSA